MDDLINFLKTLPKENLQGKEFEVLLKTFQIKLEELNLEDRSSEAGSSEQPKEEKWKRKSQKYTYEALQYLNFYFQKQSLKYIEENFKKTWSFTETFKFLNDEKNNHPNRGKPRSNIEPIITEPNLIKEFENLKLKYMKQGDFGSGSWEGWSKSKKSPPPPPPPPPPPNFFNEAIMYFGLSKTFTLIELDSVKRKKALETHPDKGGSHEEFVKMTKFYDILFPFAKT